MHPLWSARKAARKAALQTLAREAFVAVGRETTRRAVSRPALAHAPPRVVGGRYEREARRAAALEREERPKHEATAPAQGGAFQRVVQQQFDKRRVPAVAARGRGGCVPRRGATAPSFQLFLSPRLAGRRAGLVGRRLEQRRGGGSVGGEGVVAASPRQRERVKRLHARQHVQIHVARRTLVALTSRRATRVVQSP